MKKVHISYKFDLSCTLQSTRMVIRVHTCRMLSYFTFYTYTYAYTLVCKTVLL